VVGAALAEHFRLAYWQLATTATDAMHGKTTSRASLLGQMHDLGLHTAAVAFNDIAAVERELAKDDIACNSQNLHSPTAAWFCPSQGLLKTYANSPKNTAVY
jgi:hypothetical protein